MYNLALVEDNDITKSFQKKKKQVSKKKNNIVGIKFFIWNETCYGLVLGVPAWFASWSELVYSFWNETYIIWRGLVLWIFFIWCWILFCLVCFWFRGGGFVCETPERFKYHSVTEQHLNWQSQLQMGNFLGFNTTRISFILSFFVYKHKTEVMSIT